MTHSTKKTLTGIFGNNNTNQQRPAHNPYAFVSEPPAPARLQFAQTPASVQGQLSIDQQRELTQRYQELQKMVEQLKLPALSQQAPVAMPIQQQPRAVPAYASNLTPVSKIPVQMQLDYSQIKPSAASRAVPVTNADSAELAELRQQLAAAQEDIRFLKAQMEQLISKHDEAVIMNLHDETLDDE